MSIGFFSGNLFIYIPPLPSAVLASLKMHFYNLLLLISTLSLGCIAVRTPQTPYIYNSKIEARLQRTTMKSAKAKGK